jgi:hypothetical protein
MKTCLKLIEKFTSQLPVEEGLLVAGHKLATKDPNSPQSMEALARAEQKRQRRAAKRAATPVTPGKPLVN